MTIISHLVIGENNLLLTYGSFDLLSTKIWVPFLVCHFLNSSPLCGILPNFLLCDCLEIFTCQEYYKKTI